MRVSRQAGIAGALLLSAVGAYGIVKWARGGPRPSDSDRIAYLPTDTLKPVGDGLWIVDGDPMNAMGLTIPVRMTVVRLSDGSLFLHSPIQATPGLVGALRELGPVGHLVAPTSAHWMFLADWQRAFPEAISWAVPGLRDRPQVRASDVRIDRELDEAAPEPWSRDIRQGLVRGTGLTEAYFFHKPSRTLLLTDLIQNMEPASLPPLTSAFVQLARADNAKPAAHVRAAILLGGQDARRSIAEMVALRPDKVVFAHGEWFADHGAARLERAFEWL